MRRTAMIALLFAAFPAFPADPRIVNLTWLHSGVPAASLEVQFDGRATARTDANGRIEAAPDAKTIAVRDPESGLALLARDLGEDLSIRVPEPIRIGGAAGRVTGDLTVRVGDGPRGKSLTRFQRDIGALLEERPANSALSVPLPDTPLRWAGAAVDGTRFTTDWIVADPAPQLLLFDGDGNAATYQVAIPARVAPRTTVNVGRIALEPSAILDVRVALPAGDVAPSLQLIVTGGSINRAEAAVRELAVLDQRDRRLFAMLALGDPYFLPADGRLRLRLPPWLSSVSIVLSDSFGDGRIARKLLLSPRRPARLDATASDLGRIAAARAVEGIVLRDATNRTVSGATVVLADGVRRRETRTDAEGRFRFDGVTAAPPVSLFVDARIGGAPTHHRTAAFREPGANLSLRLPSAPKVSVPQRLDLSRLSALADCGVASASVSSSSSGPDPMASVDGQYPHIFAAQTPPSAQYNATVDLNALTITVTSDTSGTFSFKVFATAFLVLTATLDVEKANVPAVANLQFLPPESITLTLPSSPGSVVPAGLALLFAPPVELANWLDPTEVDLNDDLTATLPCTNVNPLALYIEDVCDGDLELKGNACTIVPPTDPLQPCTCQN